MDVGGLTGRARGGAAKIIRGGHGTKLMKAMRLDEFAVLFGTAAMALVLGHRKVNLRGFFSAAGFADSDWDLLGGWNFNKSDTASSNFGRRLRFLLLVSVLSSLTILL